MAGRLTGLARKLRRNSTYAETVLWNRLKAKQIEGIKFRRQQPIESIIVDFVSFEKRIVIEVDGGQHATDKANDLDRDRFLAKSGYRVLRFWNNEVLENVEEVLNVIREACLK